MTTVLWTVPAGAESPQLGDVLKPTNAVIAAANNANTKALAGLYSSNAVIVDTFAPYLWAGANAGESWLSAVASLGKAKVSQFKATAAKPSEIQITGNDAYVIVPVLLTGKLPNKPFRRNGAFTFTLRKADGTWKITSQAWTTTPVPL